LPGLLDVVGVKQQCRDIKAAVALPDPDASGLARDDSFGPMETNELGPGLRHVPHTI
jgi:hypothetical protein